MSKVGTWGQKLDVKVIHAYLFGLKKTTEKEKKEEEGEEEEKQEKLGQTPRRWQKRKTREIRPDAKALAKICYDESSTEYMKAAQIKGKRAFIP